jgi:hypothetical protein
VPDTEDLHVIGGVVRGRNPDDGYFLGSHGVATPDFSWKVIVGDGRTELVPNSHQANGSRLDHYLSSSRDLEAFLGDPGPFQDIPAELRDQTRCIPGQSRQAATRAEGVETRTSRACGRSLR